MRTEGFNGHVGEWRDGIEGQGDGTDFAESGEFDRQIGVFGECEDFFEGVIRGLLALADAREVFDYNGQIWKCSDYFCKFIAQKALGIARRTDDEVEFGGCTPLREGVGTIGAAVCWQANAHNALFCPLSHGRAIVCWVNDHGRLKFSRMCRHAVEHVLVIRVPRILDEDGAIDAGCVHVVEQGSYGFVFVKSDMAVCIDNGHCVLLQKGMGSKQCALFGRLRGFETVGGIIPRIIDKGGNGVCDHFLCGIGNEEVLQVCSLCGIEPEFIRISWENDGHAVVNRCHQVVGFGCDYGAGLDALFFGRMPRFPEARKGKGGAGFERDVHGGFGSAVGIALPFVKSRCGNQTPPSFEGRAK